MDLPQKWRQRFSSADEFLGWLERIPLAKRAYRWAKANAWKWFVPSVAASMSALVGWIEGLSISQLIVLAAAVLAFAAVTVNHIGASRERKERRRLLSELEELPKPLSVTVNGDLWPRDFQLPGKPGMRYVVLQNLRIANTEPQRVDVVARLIIINRDGRRSVLSPSVEIPHECKLVWGDRFLSHIIGIEAGHTVFGAAVYPLSTLIQKHVGIPDEGPSLYYCALEIEDCHTNGRAIYATCSVVFNDIGASTEVAPDGTEKADSKP